MPVKQLAERTETLYESLTAGLRFVFKKQEMLSAISLDLFAVLFGGAVALLPVFASEINAYLPQGLGVLRAAPFLGSVMMGLFLLIRQRIMQVEIYSLP